MISLWSTAPYLLNNTVGRLNPTAPTDDYNPAPSVEKRLAAFNDGIEKMLWLEKRDKDPILEKRFAEKGIKDFPGVIDRTTQISYVRIAPGYLPESLQGWGSWLFPRLFNDDGLQLGPIPRGTPVGLLANLLVRPEEMGFWDRRRHDHELKQLIFASEAVWSSLGHGAMRN